METITDKMIAENKVERFVSRFQPSYRWLACHVALPLVLTPELVNYLRMQFLRSENIPWIAEADLLLSDLCRPVGYELYVMDKDVKLYLLEELEKEFGNQRVRKIADLLVSYVKHIAKTNPFITAKDIQTQQWGAMLYLDTDKVVREIDDAISSNLLNKAELARLRKIAEDFKQQIAKKPEDYQKFFDLTQKASNLLTDNPSINNVAKIHVEVGELILEGIPIISDGVYLENFDQTPITAKIVKLFLEKYGENIKVQKFPSNPDITQINSKRLINLPAIQIKFIKHYIDNQNENQSGGFIWDIEIIFPVEIIYKENNLTESSVNSTTQEDSLPYLPTKIITIPEQLIKGSIACFPVKSQSTESNNEEIDVYEITDLVLDRRTKDKSDVDQLILFNGYQIDNYFDKVNFPSSIQSEDWQILLNNQDISREDLINLLLPFEQIYKLWQGLLSSYESYNEFESFILDTFADFLPQRDLNNLESIVGNGNYSSVVFNIIEWTRATRQLKKLINKAYEKNPNNELIREVYDYIFTETRKREDDIFANLKEFDVNVAKIEIETEPSETPQPKQETRKALVVGLNKYQSDRLPNLNNATFDADAMAKMLEDYGDFQITKFPTNDRLTWDEVNEVVFGDDLVIGDSMFRRKVNLTKEELENALIELFTPEGEDIPDVALFYFSGHGFRTDKEIEEGFLATSDALPERGFYGLSLQWLRRLLEKSPIPTQIIWLDCCFSGELFTLKSQKLNLGEKGKINNSLFVLLSSVPHKVSSESKNSAHGAFTKNLLEALNPKRLSQQFITNIDVIQYLDRQIKIKNLNQHFVSYTVLDKEFILTRLTIELKTFTSETVFVNKRGEIIKREPVSALYFEEELAEGIKLNMMQIPSGEFWMGTEDEEIERLVKKFKWDGFRKEKPQHKVTINQEFYMSQTPITQAQWKAVAKLAPVARELKENPSEFEGDDNLPVEKVSWYDAVEFCARLTRETGKNYRLPSEAEWEYACRAIKTSLTLEDGEQELETTQPKSLMRYPPFSFGETITDKLANYDASYTYADEQKGEYRQKTTPVRQFYPNSFGLYDMHGNVWEWCADTYYDSYNNAPNDGSVWDKDNNDNRYQNYLEHIDTLLNDSRRKVIRGGSWYDDPNTCRSAYRNDCSARGIDDYDGFRVVCS